MIEIEPIATSDLPDEHYIAIGKAVCAWTRLEFCIHSSLRGLARLDTTAVGRAVTGGMNPRFLIDTLRTVAQAVLSPDDIGLMKDILQEIEECYVSRNAIDHSIWWNPTQTRDVPHIESHRRGALEPEYKPMRIEDLRDLELRIGRAHLRLFYFVQQRGFSVLTR